MSADCKLYQAYKWLIKNGPYRHGRDHFPTKSKRKIK